VKGEEAAGIVVKIGFCDVTALRSSVCSSCYVTLCFLLIHFHSYLHFQQFFTGVWSPTWALIAS